MTDATRRERADSDALEHKHTRRRRVIAGVGVLVLVVTVGLGFAWWRLNGNISRVDVSSDLGERPSETTGPLNILLIGSDNREGEGVPGESLTSGARSDTTLIAHVSADREHVTVVSIPRDSMVPAPPNCTTSTPKDQWVETQWNATFALGGPACLITTIEGNTGLFINHFAVVDFNGFREMVDALGGVPICTKEAIDDPKAGLTLTAGTHVLDGEQALGFVRARKTLGDGSDLGRIERQQAFLASVVQEATRTSLLLRPDKLFGFLNAATQSLTTDSDFGLGTMRDLATSVKNIGIKNVQFITVPITEYAPDPNRVAWSPDAEALWQTLRDDEVVGEAPSTSASASAEPLTVSPTGIAVEVVNATGVQGLATQVAAALEVQGFADVATSSSGERPGGVVVEYGAGQKEAARTVAAAFNGATLRESAELTSGVRVTLGAGAPAVREIANRTGTSPIPSPTVTAPPAEPTPTITARTADQDICS
ncbi:MAG TPA: LCP family protein [Ornithinibacter sp.]|nr:LCP family protein [Ornithinibacter sp.]